MNDSKKIEYTIVLIILLVLIAYAFGLFSDTTEEEAKDFEEELEDEINKIELEQKKEILDKHIFKQQAIDRLLTRKSNKYFNLILRALIILFVGINVALYFLITDLEFLNLISWNVGVIAVVSVVQLFIFFRIRNLKELIVEELKPFVEKKVYGKRPKESIMKNIETNSKERNDVEKSLDEIGQRKVEREIRRQDRLDNQTNDSETL